MSTKNYGKKPTTSAGKRLSVKHLKLQNKIDSLKIKEHMDQMNQGVDVPYNKSHASGHKKDLKARQKYLKKAMKMKVKAAKK